MEILRIYLSEQLLIKYYLIKHLTFNIAANPKHDGCQRGIASMVYKCFYKKTSHGDGKSEIMPNQQLPKELHKPITRNFEKRKVHSSFIDNTWGADLADMQLINLIKDFNFLVCVIDIYNIYGWVVPLKYKKGITITNAFQQILDYSNRKQNKIWVDKGR